MFFIKILEAGIQAGRTWKNYTKNTSNNIFFIQFNSIFFHCDFYYLLFLSLVYFIKIHWLRRQPKVLGYKLDSNTKYIAFIWLGQTQQITITHAFVPIINHGKVQENLLQLGIDLFPFPKFFHNFWFINQGIQPKKQLSTLRRKAYGCISKAQVLPKFVFHFRPYAYKY